MSGSLYTCDLCHTIVSLMPGLFELVGHVAELLLAVLAVVACTAEMQEVAGYSVTDLQTFFRGLGPNLYNNAGELMPHSIGGLPPEYIFNKMGV